MATITLTNGPVGWKYHIHASTVDQEGTFDSNGEATITVAADFYAAMPMGIMWDDSTPSMGQGGMGLPRTIEAGGSYRVKI